MRVESPTRARTQIPCALIDPAQRPDAMGLDALVWALYESLMTGKGGAVRGAAVAGRDWVAGELDIALRTLDEARARLINGGWLKCTGRGAKRTSWHYAARIPRVTDGCYVEVPAWWAKRAQAARKQADGTTRPASDYVRPDAWWLLVRIAEKAGRGRCLDGGRGRPGVTVAYLAGLIGATSGKTGQRRLAELEAAGLVDVAARPGGRLIVRPVTDPEEAAELAARYAREGRRTEPQNSRMTAESQGPHEPRTPDRIRDSPRTESATHPGQNPRVHRSHLQSSHLQGSHLGLPAVGEVQVVGARASSADAGRQDQIHAAETPVATPAPEIPWTAPSGPESGNEGGAGPDRPVIALRPVSGDHSASTSRHRRTPVDRVAAEVFRAVPAPLADLLPEHGKRRVLAAIAAELATGHRSPAELADRIAGRGEVWRCHVEDARDITAVVIGDVVRRGYHCPDVRCEDHANLDTGLDCRACQAIKAEQTRTRLSATQTPEPPLSGTGTPGEPGPALSGALSDDPRAVIAPPKLSVHDRPVPPRLANARPATEEFRQALAALRASRSSVARRQPELDLTKPDDPSARR
ncbi:hypothetical protein ABZ897_59860 [Nonomuraea sp. NPDC046802]|uniref:hypothetical protein n=1 Tax=Nonomuraea sp. NPDC046802 TaxID=3154919 RepID=UPI0033FE6CDE